MRKSLKNFDIFPILNDRSKKRIHRMRLCGVREVRMEGGSGKKITKTKYYQHEIVIFIEKIINE